MQSQDPNQQRNLLLAVVLSMAVLLGWQLFYAGPKLREDQARQRAQHELSQPSAGKEAAKPAGAPDATVPGTAPAAVGVTREEAIKTSPRLAVDTPSLRGSIALRSGRIDDLLLVKYHE